MKPHKPQPVATPPATATPDRPEWTTPFDHLGRMYRIYKRHQTRTSPYQFCIVRNGRRTRHSLETNVASLAIDRAKKLIDQATAGKWDQVEKLKTRRQQPVSSLAQILELYPQIAQVSSETIYHNTLAIRWLIEVATGQDLQPDAFPLSSLTAELIGQFQRNTVTKYQEQAAKSEAAQREARERALRTTRSVIRQARSLFTKKRSLVDGYARHGVTVPDLTGFMTTPIEGRVTKTEYHPPPDSVVEQAMTDIHKLVSTDPNVYTAFWLAIGAGLRRSEIRQMKWEYFVERNGITWISGGIGKDGEKIQVPIQTRAMEALAIVRQTTGRCLGEETGLYWARRLNYWMRNLGWNTQKKMHELRSYIGSLIYRQDPLAAMRFLRHKTILQTERFYVRYGQDSLPPQVL
jgi:integrase